MPPKRKKPTKTEDDIKADAGTKAEGDEVKAGSHVYVLTRKAHSHAGDGQEIKIVGIYNSKNAAIASAGDVDADYYASFNEAIASNDPDEEYYEDYRNAAPDSGLLLQFGSEDQGEGDNVQVFIEKTVVLGMPEPSKKKAKPSKTKAAVNNENYYVY